MTHLSVDRVASAFNENCPSHWRARPYSKARDNGAVNVCVFTYKNGMVQFSMDCDRPIGQGFTVKFQNFMGSFGDFTSAIQKGLYQILTRLSLANLAPGFPPIETPNDIAFSLRKDGRLIYLAVVAVAGLWIIHDLSDDEAPDDRQLSLDDLL